MRKEEDCLKACIKRQVITSNAKEGGNVYRILMHAKQMVKEANYMKFLSRHFKRCLNIQKSRGRSIRKIQKNTFDWNRNNIAAFADELVSRKEDLEERIHIIEALQWAQNHSEQIIEVIEGAEDYYDARAKVMETFGFDHTQAQSVTEMRVRAFCEIEKEKLSGELQIFRGKMELFQE